MGDNAIHAAGAGAATGSRAYEPRRPVIDGLEYHEGLNAVFISGGVAGNVVPDRCVVTVNYRFAPDRSEEEALAFVREFFAPYDVAVDRLRARRAARALAVPAAAAFVEAVGGDGATRSSAGPTWPGSAASACPAVNFGPGDPIFAHKQDEHVPGRAHRTRRERQLRTWLRRG